LRVARGTPDTFYNIGTTSVLTTINTGDATDQKVISFFN
jgi:hypothetical protein